jgi:hypothetical protein
VKPPLCRLCEKEHWAHEPHIWPAYVAPAPVLRAAANAVAETVTKPEILETEPRGCGAAHCCGRPRKYKSNAEKQAAYRQRKKGQA